MAASIEWVSYLYGALLRATLQCKMSDETEKQQMKRERQINAARATVEGEIAQYHCQLLRIFKFSCKVNPLWKGKY